MSEEWDASNPEFHALFILEDGASVARIWGVKGCTIIAIIYDLGVTEGEVAEISPIRRIQLKRYGVFTPRLYKKTCLTNSQYGVSMLSTYAVSMEITIRRYSKSSKLGMISLIDLNVATLQGIQPNTPLKMDNPNITMKEYIRLQEEKDRSQAIVLDNTLTSDAAFSCGPTVSPLNYNKIDFRISFDESDDEDYTIVYDENSFSNKIISVNNLKTDFENDNDKVNMSSFPSPEPEVSYFNDLDFFKDFEN
ncbi:hypothetical protein Tco_1002159 [Tanacetum coccineum]|uniref:Uncharacterized protein n=1 Tax=Tanacetum coccineum TaxID=301880 RepID=A0ABQ5F5G9_9ASTR